MPEPRFDWSVDERYPNLEDFIKNGISKEDLALLIEKFGPDLDDGDTSIHDILTYYVALAERDLPKGEGLIYHLPNQEDDEEFFIIHVRYRGE
jgi:hypothetical protein